jgi:hypothetical protein
MMTVLMNIIPMMTTSPVTAPVVISGGAGALTMIQKRLCGMDNHSTWKFIMNMPLVLGGLYNSVTRIDTGEGHNQTAIAQIALCVVPQCYVHIVDARTAKEAWGKTRNGTY